ncbi:hypothetical protein [Clostridium rectalis]|nr:hypothetical protein [Clostridium rectalis]
MDKQSYLLTYIDCGEEDFGWFESEEDVRKFIIDRRVAVIEC